MDFDHGVLFQMFLTEAEEHLADLEEGLLALEARPDDEEIVRGVFRSAHTIKGSAATVGFSDIVEYAHAIEEILDQFRRKTMAPSPGLAQVLLQAADALRQMVHAKARLSAADLEALGQEMARSLGEVDADAAPGPTTPSRGPGQVVGGERLRTLRIGVDRLDRLLEITGEIAIARRRVGALLGEAGAPAAAALDAHHEADRLHAELQEQVMAARMVPVGPLLRRYGHTVREIAGRQGKRVAFRVEGVDVLVDTTVMEAVRDPLTHLARNAVDHGIELPEARQARAKDPFGHVTLRARSEPRAVVFEVSDDGNGIDGGRVIARARALGLVAGSATPSDEEIQQLVFQSGLSTAAKVTEGSGRGVGLDVVRRNVEARHGSVSIASVPGQGTTISLRLPLTLAIVDGLVVGVGAQRYVLPLEAVTECMDLPESERSRAGHGVVELRGEAVPYLRLRELFGVGEARAGRESLIVLRHGLRHAGLAVDSLHGECEAVTRPLGALLRGAPGITGSTILATGQVAMVLDLPGLLRQACVHREGGTA